MSPDQPRVATSLPATDHRLPATAIAAGGAHRYTDSRPTSIASDPTGPMTSSSSDDDSMAPAFLVASPKLDGGPFERAVILLVHHDEEGAMGHIVNRPVDVDFGTLITGVNEELSDDILDEHYERPVYFGGPVRAEQLWLLVGRGLDQPKPSEERRPDRGDVEVDERWRLISNGRIIEEYAVRRSDDVILPMLGYAGWGGGQLEGELEEGAWLIGEFDDRLLYETEADDRWERALEAIGVGPTAFLMMGSVGSA